MKLHASLLLGLDYRVTNADKALCPLLVAVCQIVNVTFDTFFCVPNS